MKVNKKELEKSQIELNVELSWEEFEPYVKMGAEKISKEIKVDGFRPGKVPYDVLKEKIGEMSILEESARIAINKTIDEAIKKNVKEQAVGQPRVDISKIAPDNPLEYKVVLSLLPKVELGEYKDLKIKKEEIKVEKKDLDSALDYMRESGIKEVVVDREVQDTDKVTVAIEMFQDKVPVEGGQTQDTAIIVGKDYLIPGFDKHLLGAKKGDKKDFKIPYPKDHYQKNLAGKMVEFKVKIKDVYARELPELNDEFAKKFGAKNMKDLEKLLENNLKAEKEQSVRQKEDMKIMDKIVEKAKFGEIPEELINNEVDATVHEMEHSVANQGGKFEDYLASLKKSMAQFKLDLVPGAIKKIKGALAIREISIQEKIEVTEKEVDKKQKELIEQYKGYEKVVERVKEPSYKLNLYNILTNQKTLDKLREWNLVK